MRGQYLLFVILLPLVSCVPTGNQADNVQTVTNTGKKCSSGEVPKIINGKCQGHWEVVKGLKGNICNFVWGPAVKCPNGMKSLTYESVCYGTTTKGEKTKNIRTVSDCISKFGKSPSTPDYELICCEK